MADSREAAIYNIKAVARLTGVAADTLRRWESRYNILSPQRTTGGYRMYSTYDVDTIRWLKARVDEGLTISRACELLRTREDKDPAARLALPGGGAPHPEQAAGGTARTLPVLVSEILQHLGQMEEGPAAQVLGEALALYSLEQVIEELVYPALVEVGERWLRGGWSIGQEHFASAFIRGRLANLLHMSPANAGGRLVLVACAPEELHEIGALIVALYLRRAGYRVIYLGQNVPLESLITIARTMQPAALCCSASRADTASNLRPLAQMVAECAQQTGYRPLVTYGGAIFNRHPGLAEQMGAVYLGATVGEAIARVRRLAA